MEDLCVPFPPLPMLLLPCCCRLLASTRSHSALQHGKRTRSESHVRPRAHSSCRYPSQDILQGRQIRCLAAGADNSFWVGYHEWLLEKYQANGKRLLREDVRSSVLSLAAVGVNLWVGEYSRLTPFGPPPFPSFLFPLPSPSPLLSCPSLFGLPWSLPSA